MKEIHIFNLKNKINNCDGARFLTRLNILSLSFNVYRKNFQALRKIIQKVETSFVLEQINNDKIGLTQDFLHEEILRLLHNFLASAKTLVDHTRIFVIETYSETSFHSDYQIRIEGDFKSDGVTKFIHDLRNYILHKGLPLTSLKTSIIVGKSIETSIFLDIAALRMWGKWSKVSKDYVVTLADSERLLDIVEDYHKKVDSFYQWFLNRLFELHDQDLKYLNRLQGEIKKLTGKKTVEGD